MGAGILPVSVYYGTLFLLFGKEKNSGLWSDFGGSRKGYYESDFNTAIREGSEELNGLLGTSKHLRNRVSSNLINVYQIKSYNSYLFKVNKDNKLPLYFKNIDKFYQYNLPHSCYTQDGLFEKDSIRWFTICELEKEIINFRPFYRTILRDIIKDKSILYNNVKNNVYYCDVNKKEYNNLLF